jgi:hypothetical protein
LDYPRSDPSYDDSLKSTTFDGVYYPDDLSNNDGDGRGEENDSPKDYPDDETSLGDPQSNRSSTTARI